MYRYINKEIIIQKNIELVFDALISPSMIKKWWFANSAIVLPEVDGFYAAAWGADEDHPDYISFAKIIEIKPPYKLSLKYEKYFSKDGPLPFDAELDATFILEKLNKQTKLIVRQNGFPIDMAANEYYQACVKGWEDTFNSIKNILENE